VCGVYAVPSSAIRATVAYDMWTCDGVFRLKLISVSFDCALFSRWFYEASINMGHLPSSWVVGEDLRKGRSVF